MNWFKRTSKPECDHEFERWTLNKQRFFLIGRGLVEDVSNRKFPKPVLRCTKCEGIVLRDDVIRVVMEVSYDMPIEQGCDSEGHDDFSLGLDHLGESCPPN